MKKTSHFCEMIFAKSAHSLTELRMKLGPAGPGIYMCIIEALFDEPNSILPREYDIIAYRFGLSSEQVRTVIEDFNLFEFTEDGKEFYCELLRAQRQPKPKRAKSSKTNESTPTLETLTRAKTMHNEAEAIPESASESLSQQPLPNATKDELQINEFTSLKLKTQTDLLRNDLEWLNCTAAFFGISQDTLLEDIDKYEEFCQDNNDMHNSYSNLKYQFTNWYNQFSNHISDEYCEFEYAEN